MGLYTEILNQNQKGGKYSQIMAFDKGLESRDEDTDRFQRIADSIARAQEAPVAEALSTGVAQQPPPTIVQRILDGAEEKRQMVEMQGKPETSIRAPTPEEEIDEENARYYQSQIAPAPWEMGAGLLSLQEREPEEIKPQEVAEAQIELEMRDLVREKGVKGARDYLQRTGMLQKQPVVERYFNAVVGKTPGVTEQMLTTGPEAFVSDLAGILTGLVAPSKITRAAGITTRAALGLRRAGAPGRLAEIGGRAAGTGATFGMRGVQEVAARIADDEEVTPEDAAKHVVNFTLFGGGLGAVGAVPQAVLRIPAEGLYGYLTAYFQGASPEEAILTGALFMGFGLMNRRNLSFELKDAAFARLLRSTEKKLAGEGIPAEAINRLKQDMYRVWTKKVNPTLDDLIKAQDELTGIIRKEAPSAEGVRGLPQPAGEAGRPAEAGKEAGGEVVRKEVREKPEAPKEVVTGIAEKPEVSPGDIISTDLIKGRVIEPGFLGKAKHPGYTVEVLTGHEKGQKSFIMTEDIQSVEKVEKPQEAPTEKPAEVGVELTGAEVRLLTYEWHKKPSTAERTEVYEKIKAHYLAKATAASKPPHWDLIEKPEEAIESAAHDAANMAISARMPSDNAWVASLKRSAEAAVEDKRSAAKREKEAEGEEEKRQTKWEVVIERSKEVRPVEDKKLTLKPSVYEGNRANLNTTFVTDGHIMIRKSAITSDKRVEKLESEHYLAGDLTKGQGLKKEGLDSVWKPAIENATAKVEVLGWREPVSYHGASDRLLYIHVEGSNFPVRALNADYVRLLKTYAPFDKIKADPKTGLTAVVFYRGQRAIGLLMPVKSEELVDVETARRALAGEFAEVITPTEGAPAPTKGTAATADIGPDLFHEQELRQAFPEAEASPFEPLGPFAKDIEPRKGLGSDLMEAARMIAAPARYKKLRASMLGVFRKPDKIELGDIRWIRTLAHELGHAVDYRLTNFPRSIRKRFPDLGVSEHKAREELKRASEYFRPLPKGAKWDRGTPHMRYRAKHVELMADLVGLYTLSPKKARELAPNVTEALEGAIAGSGDIKTAIRMVLEPEQVEFIEKRGRETMTELPPKPEFVKTEADAQIRKEAFDVVKLTSREMEVQLVRTHAFDRRLRKSLSEKERESLTLLIEGIGDPRIEGDTFKDVQKRSTPEVRKMARESRYETELNRQEANKIAQEAGDGPEWLRYIADYVPHFWVVPRKKALEYAGRWRKSTPHTKQRTFPTFADGVALDWEPVSYDFAYLYSRAAENNFRAAITRRFARRIKDMRTAGGEPVMVGSLDKAGPDWVKIDHPVLRHVYARRTKDGKLILGEGNAYVHPSIARPVKVLLERPFRGAFSKVIYAINSAGKSLNVAFSFFHEIALFESSQAVNAKFLNPLRGIFIGPFESRMRGLEFKPHLTHRAGFLLAEKDIYGFADAAKHGLAIRRSPATIDYARTYLERQLRKIEARTRKVPALSFMTTKIRSTYEAYQRHLWDNVHSGLKLFAYNTLVAETMTDMPADVSARQVKETTASVVNDAFGGQEFIELPAKHGGKISWEPATVRQVQILHGLLFAPDWTFSNIRIAGRPIINARNRIMAKRGARYWRNMLATVYGSAIILQKIIYEIYKDGDPDLKEWAWNNEPDREFDIDVTPLKRSIQKALGGEIQERRSYIHAGKQFREVGRYFQDWPKGLIQNIGNKSSVLVRLVIEQVSGHQAGSGFPMPWVESGFQEGLDGWKQVIAMGKAAGEHFIPFSWQENNFAFAVPHRRGMSKYRAARHYKEAMAAYSDPSWWDKIKTKATREDQEGALIKVFQQVDAALKANGQDEASRKVVFNSARSNLRGRFYGKFLQAIEEQDWKAADDYAVILLNLGATGITAKQSAERRGKKELWSDEAKKIFKSRWELRSVFLDYKRIMRTNHD